MSKTKGKKVKFRIRYKADWGQSLFIAGSSKVLGNWEMKDALELTAVEEDLWEGEISFSEDRVRYKYAIGTKDHSLWEYGDDRELPAMEIGNRVEVIDSWRTTGDPRNNLDRSPFENAFFKRSKTKSTKSSNSEALKFRLKAIRVPDQLRVGILGSTKALGNWNPKKVVLMSDSNFPFWEADIPLAKGDHQIEYKYVLYNISKKEISHWEYGDNRKVNLLADSSASFILNDEYLRCPDSLWKAAGVAIPVFSLKTKQSSGIGDFADLKMLTKWANATGMKVLQILPINDTTATHRWTDSYPYASISVQALHPIYISLDELGSLKDKGKQNSFEERKKKLNSLSEVDYEGVLSLKMEFLRESYNENFKKVSKTKAFQSFLKNNEDWIRPYAAFCALRDHFETPDFRHWKAFSTVSQKKLDDLFLPESEFIDTIQLYLYIQYQLDSQLRDATHYARENGVVLKGDIPIGIYRNSVEAWWEPHLFKMDMQAGAPPDDFSITGQNWGFPTYNWEVMQENGYKWWTRRLTKMAEYFDIIRIDHILGFFRIWEIPIEQVDGLLGRFNPCLPFSEEELRNWGLGMDYSRYCEPYIRYHMVQEIFQSHAPAVFEKYLDEYAPGCFRLKESFNTQSKIRSHFEEIEDSDTTDFGRWLKHNLYRLVSEVLFVESGPGEYCPRVGLHSTYSFQELGDHEKSVLDRLYNHFFYHRHNEFWREKAMNKLPAIKEASNMLICGEDLGMVPASVPGVMKDLNILSLAVQRMPNDDRGFWHPSDTSYESVTTTSSHDTSTLREWWQEDAEKSRQFYHKIMGRYDEPPYFLEPWLATDIINQHMYSPSILAIFPLQDLLAMDSELRRQNPEEERINVPANPMHYWRYRMHVTIEDLISNKKFSSFLKSMVAGSGRTE